MFPGHHDFPSRGSHSKGNHKSWFLPNCHTLYLLSQHSYYHRSLTLKSVPVWTMCSMIMCYTHVTPQRPCGMLTSHVIPCSFCSCRNVFTDWDFSTESGLTHLSSCHSSLNREAVCRWTFLSHPPAGSQITRTET